MTYPYLCIVPTLQHTLFLSLYIPQGKSYGYLTAMNLDLNSVGNTLNVDGVKLYCRYGLVFCLTQAAACLSFSEAAVATSLLRAVQAPA